MDRVNKKMTPFQQMEQYLHERYTFRHNVVLNKIEYESAAEDRVIQLDEYRLNSIFSELHRKGIAVHKSLLVSYLYSDSWDQFDPFIRYFDALPEWNAGMDDYIAKLTATIKVKVEDMETWNIYLRRWLIGLVGCAIDVKTVNQTVLVLIGSQGIGKTKWIESLVPKELKSYYYSGNINPGDKDTSINLAECLIINLDELGNLNRGDSASLKQTITQSNIRIRRPYAALNETLPRRASFIGSVNDLEFLRDDTGNRRYLCMEAEAIQYNHTVPMDLVYAQAYHLYKNGGKHWFVGAEVDAINKRNQQYKVQFAELDYVTNIFKPCSPAEKPDIELTTTELLEYIKDRDAKLYVSLRSLGIAMRQSDFTRTKRDGRWYYRLKYNTH